MSNVLQLRKLKTRKQSANLARPATPSLKAARRSAGSDSDEAARAGDNALRKAALLELLGRKPVTFHRVYVEIAGGVLPAIWLAQATEQALESSDTTLRRQSGIVFSMTASECESATGLTRSQQATCRRKLMQEGLISRFGKQGRAARYLLHREVISQRLLEIAQPLAQQLERLPALHGAVR